MPFFLSVSCLFCPSVCPASCLGFKTGTVRADSGHVMHVQRSRRHAPPSGERRWQISNISPSLRHSVLVSAPVPVSVSPSHVSARMPASVSPTSPLHAPLPPAQPSGGRESRDPGGWARAPRLGEEVEVPEAEEVEEQLVAQAPPHQLLPVQRRKLRARRRNLRAWAAAAARVAPSTQLGRGGDRDEPAAPQVVERCGAVTERREVGRRGGQRMGGG